MRTAYLIVMLCVAGCGGGGSDVDGGVADANTVVDASTRCAQHIFEDISIPMRDGKTLAAFARRAQDPTCQLPTVLVQTPYDKENSRSLWFQGNAGDNPLFDSYDYNFVVLDWRGFYASATAAVAQPNRGEDGYDAVEWIAQQNWSDGKVGTWGVSALCRAQHWTAIEQPPSLVAAVPIFCAMNDTYLQYYPGGVLRREYVDTLGALFGGSIVMDHPTHDGAWSLIANLRDPTQVSIPMLIVAGWFDLDNNSSFETWNDLVSTSAASVRDDHRLLVGSWHHFAAGGESVAGGGLSTQELKFWDSAHVIQTDSLAWFDHYLRGRASAASSWPRVRYHRSGEDTWAGAEEWPPTNTSAHNLYLSSGGTLTTAPPLSGSVDFTYNPVTPSPSVGGQSLRFDLDHGPHDQAAVLSHGEANAFVTAPLTSELAVRGVIEVELDVTTTGIDTDFAVRLTDVDASGNHLLIGEGIRRLKLRDGYTSVSAVTPGQRYSLRITLQNHLAHTFLPGHRVGLIVTSSNWPRFDRNPNTGNDFFAQAAVPVTVTNTVHVDGASRLVLPSD